MALMIVDEAAGQNAIALPSDVAKVDSGCRPGGLTPRELEVLWLLAEAKTSKEIALELSVALPTVSRHIANIYAKIDARNRVEATRYALSIGGNDRLW